MKKMSLLMAVGVMFVGCSGMKEPGCCVCVDALRVAALQSSAWDSAEWISVKGAPIAGEGEKKLQRAADGTSVFWRDIANKKTVKSAKWMTSGLGVYDLYLNGFRVGDDALKPGFWIYRRAAGIAADPANPGFRNIIMMPEPIISSVDLI